jgi:tRNA dimethylallyltransferase
MDIGSNKPTPEEIAATRHHMVDICEPKQTLSAGEFVLLVTPVIYDILDRGGIPILVGGSTMWLQWLVHGTPDAPKPSPFALEESERMIGHLQLQVG